MTERSKFPSEGARRLSAKGSQSDIGRKLGVSQQTVWFWFEGRNRPKGEHLKSIAAVFGIPIQAWFRADTKAA